MDYAIKYYKGNPANSKGKEIIIKFHTDDTKAGLIKFLEEVKEKQRLIIDVCDLSNRVFTKNFDVFVAIAKEKEDFALKIDESKTELIEEIKAAGIPFFFDTHINSWSQLKTVAELGVSDVYITDEFAFELKTISEYCNDNNIKIRVFPNVAQTTNGNKQDISSFYIRPEDEFIYEFYVDIYEFWGPLDRQDVLMRIYSDRKWDGDLGTLILNLDTKVNSNAFPPCFGEARTHCGKRCLRGKCDICYTAESFGKAVMGAGKAFHYDYT